jgi:hypothetical protein
MLDASFGASLLQPDASTPIVQPPRRDEQISQNDDDADGDTMNDDDMADGDVENDFGWPGRPVGSSLSGDGTDAGNPSLQGVIGTPDWQRKSIYDGGDGVGASATRNSVADMDSQLDYTGLASPAIRTGSWRR